MKIDYKTNKDIYSFEIKELSGVYGIDILLYIVNGSKGWFHQIIDDKIIWYENSIVFLHLTPEVIKFAEKVVQE